MTITIIDQHPYFSFLGKQLIMIIFTNHHHQMLFFFKIISNVNFFDQNHYQIFSLNYLHITIIIFIITIFVIIIINVTQSP